MGEEQKIGKGEERERWMDEEFLEAIRNRDTLEKEGEDSREGGQKAFLTWPPPPKILHPPLHICNRMSVTLVTLLAGCASEAVAQFVLREVIWHERRSIGILSYRPTGTL